MPPIIVAILLILGLVIIHFQTASAPLERERPLDVDSLPSPWLVHAGTISSLTALFGAYWAIFLLCGAMAILGVAVGGVLGLWFLRKTIRASGALSFEAFLGSRNLAIEPSSEHLFWLLLALTQVGFAISELLILRELVVHAFGISPNDATVFAVSLAMVAYFYCLRGGYLAAFRTEMVQFAFALLMCAVISGSAAIHFGSSSSSWTTLVSPLRPRVWVFELPLFSAAVSLVNFLIGACTGGAFFIASPDTWKRVFIVSRAGESTSSFGALVVLGTLPFVLLAPAAILLPRPELSGQAFDFFRFISHNQITLTCLLLGMSAVFLSFFENALITATHVIMLKVRKPQPKNVYTLSLFHYVMGGTFAVIVVGFMAFMAGLENPYLMGLFLIYSYATVAAATLSTSGL